jgi:hypothetical protein
LYKSASLYHGIRQSSNLKTDYRYIYQLIHLYFSLLHCIRTGSGAHPASYPMGNGGSFPGSKAAKALN